MRIVLPGGGSITVKSADDPDALRGVGLDGVVLDEAAFMKEEAWINGIRPALVGSPGLGGLPHDPERHELGARPLRDGREQRGLGAMAATDGRQPDHPAQGTRGRTPGHGRAAVRPGAPRAVRDRRRRHVQARVAGGALRRVGTDHYRLPGGDVVAHDKLRRFATVDLAVSTRTTADYSVVAVFGLTPENVILVLDLRRARLEGPDLVPWMREACRRWDLPAIWIEKAGFQLALDPAGAACGAAGERASARPRQGEPGAARDGGLRGRAPAASPRGGVVPGPRVRAAVVSEGPTRRPGRCHRLRRRGGPRGLRSVHGLHERAAEVPQALPPRVPASGTRAPATAGEGSGQRMVGHAGESGRRPGEWELWEARRARAPKAAPWELRDARESARLLLMVVNARFHEGQPPFEHVERLAAVAEDERLTPRLRVRAGEALARLHVAGIRGAAGLDPAPPGRRKARRRP